MSEETPSTPLEPTPRLSRPEVTPAPPPNPPPAESHTGLFVGIVSVLALLLVAAIGIGVMFVGAKVAKRSSKTFGPVAAATFVTSSSGNTVFSDDFHDPASGWRTTSLPSGTSFKYTPDGYVVVAEGTLDHFADAPYDTPVSQIAMAVTATQSTDAPLAAGYGVSCWRGTDTGELRYDFLLTAAGKWSVDRRDGGVLATAKVRKQGRSTGRPGSTPVVVTGICATLADQHTVRLIMFAGTEKLADFTDSATALPDTGWLADLELTSSAIHDSTVTVTHFEIRDVAQ